MSSRKASGAQNRKRKLEIQKQAKQSSKMMEAFLKKQQLEVSLDEDVTVSEEMELALDEDEGLHSTDGIVQNKDVDLHPTTDVSFPYGDKSSLHEDKAVPQTDTSVFNNEEIVLSNEQLDLIEDESVSLYNNETLGGKDVSVPTVLLLKDIGYLNFDEETHLPVFTDKLRIEIITKGSYFFQNKEGPFSAINGRSMTSSWFRRKLANGLGHEVNRSWLLYSPSKASAFCFCCLLFPTSKSNSRSSFEVSSGFKNWKKGEKVVAHENNPSHRQSFSTWKEAERRILQGKIIDAETETQIQMEKKRWQEILKRILDCIKYLATQNLALRAHREKIEDVSGNSGNFLTLIKLLAKYDPILAQHIERAQNNPGSTSYLSPTLQNEFIKNLASNVRKQLLDDIKRNKYYGILFDSTPDIAHREQLSKVIRYVDIDFKSKNVCIKETFLGFIQIHEKNSEAIEKVILEELENDSLPLAYCRSQCYDNAAVMSGHLNGVQKRIINKNPKALFINCDNHTLNLVGLHAAKQDVAVVTFFGTIESIYIFFSRSTSRWEELKKVLPKTVKRESETRWSARAEAVKAVHTELDKLVQLLEKLAEDSKFTVDTRNEADTLLHNVLNFNFLVLLNFWNSILSKIDRIQKRLQDPAMNFKDAAYDLDGLKTELENVREEISETSMQKAKTKCEEWGIKIEKRTRRRRRMPGEFSQDVGLSAEDEIRRVMFNVIDRLCEEVKSRFTRISDLDAKFGFLLNVKTLVDSNAEDLKKNCLDFGKFYDTDVSGEELFTEICDLKMLLSSRKEALPVTPIELISFIISYGEDVFPNLRIALQMLLTISVSIASCERTFSKMKLIMSYLRASMGQSRLSDLALLSIEKETFEKIDFDHVIEQFAAAKSRKIHLL